MASDAPLMQERMGQVLGVIDVNSDLQMRARTAYIDINRDLAARLGITVDQIRDQFYSAFGTRQVSTIYAPEDTYQVILEADQKYFDTSDVLRKLALRTPGGAVIPLDTVATLKEAVLAVREGCRVATFALIEDYWGMDWVGFVDQLARLTKGVAFYTSSGELANCVMESYLSGRKKKAYLA